MGTGGKGQSLQRFGVLPASKAGWRHPSFLSLIWFVPLVQSRQFGGLQSPVKRGIFLSLHLVSIIQEKSYGNIL